ncbi:hypothetical protein CPI23_04895 [Moraxella catarrhalis]|uniref:hypothetical protein n=1 Tax=Moraxella catarrhalis TaxID=480 RepID=UPI00128E3B5F|nr:hypothetical protein [Moraxella catarrhalis]MPX66506.1 hypothetical protein [Moraxella catarrhalis]
MKKSTIQYLSLPTAALLTLVGCSHDNHRDDEMAVAEPVIQQIDDICQAPAMQANLQNSIKQSILDATISQMTDADPNQRLAIQNTIGQKLNTLQITTQNATNFADSCMADVHVTVNPQDLANAEFAFARSGVTLLQRASQDQVEFYNGTIVAKQITYQMVNGNVVMYGNNHNAIRLIADILAASTSSLPQVSIQPDVTARPQAIERLPETPIAMPSNPQEDSSVTTYIEQKPAPNAQVSSRPRSEMSSNNSAQTPTQNSVGQSSAAGSTPRVDRDSQAKANTERTTERSANKTSQDLAHPQPPTANASSDGKTSISIVESNETY